MKKMLVILLLSNIFIFSTIKPAAAAAGAGAARAEAAAAASAGADDKAAAAASAGADDKAANENRIKRLFDFCANGRHKHCAEIHTFGCHSYRCNDYCQGSDENECFENFIKNSDDINFQVTYALQFSLSIHGILEGLTGASPLHAVICGPLYLDYPNATNRISAPRQSHLFDGRANNDPEARNELARVDLNGPLAQRRVQMVNILLCNPRINVNLQNDNGDTPLLLAVRSDLLSTECRNQIISALLAAGADVTIQNKHGLCFLDYVPLLDVARGNNNLRTVYQVLKGQNVTAAYHKKTIDALTEAELLAVIPSSSDELQPIPPELLKEISDFAVGLPSLK